MVSQLLREPSAFMDRKVGQPNLRMEFVVVFTVGVLGAVGNAYVGLNIVDAMGDSETAQLPVAGYVAEPVIGAVLLWFGYSFGLHLISNRVFNTRDPLRRVLKATAWALIPVGVGNLLRLGVLYLVYTGVDYESVLAENDGTGFNTGLDAVLSEGASDPLYVLAPLITVLAALATGYLLVYATQSAKDLPREEAFRVVAPLVAVHVLYIAWSAVNALGI